MKKKLLALMIIFCMTVTLIPVTALEASAASYNPAKSVPTDLTGNQAENIVKIAKSQAGYQGTQSNGRGKGDWTAYGAWYGENGGPWCAIFVSWCAAQAGIPQSIIPKESYVPNYYNSKCFKEKQFHDRSYKPKEGDLIIIDWNGTGQRAHVGIVEKSDSKKVYIIDGNTGNDDVTYRKTGIARTSKWITGYITPNYTNEWTGDLTASADTSEEAIRLNWAAHPEARIYRISRSVSKKGRYITLDTIYKTKTTFTDSSIVAGEKYYYKVQVLDSGLRPIATSQVVSMRCPVAELELNLTNDASGKPKLTWTKIKNTYRYYVYRASSRNGEYDYLGRTEGQSYSDNKAAVGDQYYYVEAKTRQGKVLAKSGIESITCRLATPVVKIEKTKSEKPRLTWRKITGADEYKVYRATEKDGKYTRLDSIKGLSYIDEKAKPGNSYYYKVKAIYKKDSQADSAYSDEKKYIYRLAIPEVTGTVRASDGSPMLTWDPVDGATKYIVYRSTNRSRGYTEKIRKPASDCSYVNTDAKAGVTYYYKVRAICNNTSLNSAYSRPIAVTCGSDMAEENKNQETLTQLKAPTIRVTLTSSGKPRVEWEKVPGAESYMVYRSTSRNGYYEEKWPTANLHYTNTDAQAGVKYYYKVKAIAKKGSGIKDSKFSAVKSITCRLATPEVTGTTISTGKPKLTWEKVPGAESYIVYRATSRNGYYEEKWPTANLHYTNTDAVKGKTYYYKVKAICANGAAGDSDYSKIVSITCK